MRLLALLGLVALGLAGVIGVELSAPPARRVPPAAPASAASRAPVLAPDAAATRWAQVLLARPLFSPDRRPPDVVRSAAAAHALPRLAGVLVGPEGRRALFAGGVVLAEGGALGPWRVAGIAAGQVTLTGPGGVRVLRPAFAALVPMTPIPPPPPVPTALPTPLLLAAPK